MMWSEWEYACDLGDNLRIVAEKNVPLARAAVRFVEMFEMVPDNAPTFLGFSPTLDEVPCPRK